MTKLLWVWGSAWLIAAPAQGQSGQAVSGPTWNQDVAPIAYATRATRHRPGEVAPMSVLTDAGRGHGRGASRPT
jgi:hypothetical protein